MISFFKHLNHEAKKKRNSGIPIRVIIICAKPTPCPYPVPVIATPGGDNVSGNTERKKTNKTFLKSVYFECMRHSTNNSWDVVLFMSSVVFILDCSLGCDLVSTIA